MWAAYAADLVRDARHVYQVASISEAIRAVRAVGGVRNAYFIGHGSGSYYFRVRTVGSDIHAVDNASFSSPLRFAADGSVLPITGSGLYDPRYLLASALAQAMAASRGPHRLEFRACYLQPTNVIGIARLLGRLQRELRVVATGYRSYYTLAARADGTWRSSLESPSGQTRPGTRVAGTAAPPPEILARVRDGQTTVELPRAGP